MGLRAADNAMTVFKTSTCGCCIKWVEHLRANGFQVTVQDVPSTDEYSRKHGVPEALRSCHVGVVEGYAIEGHVPAADIKRLLKERPAVRGLAVSGMPSGSPGMEQGHVEAYDVLSYDKAGKSAVYARH